MIYTGAIDRFPRPLHDGLQMNPTPNRESLPAVTAAGVVAIIFSAFGVLCGLLVGFSLLLMPEMATTSGAPPMPQGVRTVSAAIMFLMLALAVFGIFVGIGILRRRNWARITVLVWGGFMAFVCVGAVAFSFVIFGMMPMQLPNVSAADTGHFMMFMRIFLAVFYGIPACVGIWWIVLFTRTRVANAFTNLGQDLPAMDASGFPQMEVSAAARQPKRPACPLPLAILAGFFIFSSLCTLMFVLIPMPFAFPFYFFGHISSGLQPRIVFGIVALVLGISGVGMLKLKRWALDSLLAVQSIFFVNGLFSIVSPAFQTDMRDAIEKISIQYSAFPGGNPFLSDTYFRAAMISGLVFGAIIIGLLVFLRSRFLEQAAAANAKA
jgi:hypothetical protein